MIPSCGLEPLGAVPPVAEMQRGLPVDSDHCCRRVTGETSLSQARVPDENGNGSVAQCVNYRFEIEV
jgi:hypothetical protein